MRSPNSKPLLTRVERGAGELMVEDLERRTWKQRTAVPSGRRSNDPIRQGCRVSRLCRRRLKARGQESSRKRSRPRGASGSNLLQLTLDRRAKRAMFLAGIKSAYAPESLPKPPHGELVANPARKMAFRLLPRRLHGRRRSGGDILLLWLSPDSGAETGMRVK